MNVKKTIIIHPILFAIFPALFLFSYNIKQLRINIIIVPTLIIICFASLLWLLLGFVVREKEKAALLVSIFLVLFFSYGHVHSLLKNLSGWGYGLYRHRYLLCAWTTIFAFGSYLCVKIRKNLNSVTALFNIVGVCLVATSLINSAFYKAKSQTIWQRDTGGVTVDAADIKKIDKLPNIYYIILDAYAGADILKEVYSYDNSGFYNYLNSKGFYVANHSRSNYIFTHLSLASSLNFRYCTDFDDKAEGVYIENNRVFDFLKQHGYTIVTFSSAISYIDIRNADTYIGPRWYFNEFQNELLKTTPLSVLLFKLGVPYALHRKHILFTFDHLANMHKMKKPFFIFAHILAPHPPFVFGENGEPVEFGRTFSFNDGIDRFTEDGGTKEEYLEGYKNQVIFVNKKIKEVIDEIISNSSEPPIIILQGDHGPRSTFEWESSDKANFKEYFSILNAYYMPHNDNVGLYDGISPVNTFRIIFNHYFDTNYELLKDKSYTDLKKPPISL